jgi:hypothetical protein
MPQSFPNRRSTTYLQNLKYFRTLRVDSFAVSLSKCDRFAKIRGPAGGNSPARQKYEVNAF